MAPKKVSAAARAAAAGATTAASPTTADTGVAKVDTLVVAPTAVGADIGLPVTSIEPATSGAHTAVFGIPNGDATTNMPVDQVASGSRRRSRGNTDTDNTSEKNDHKKRKKEDTTKDKKDKQDKKHQQIQSR